MSDRKRLSFCLLNGLWVPPTGRKRWLATGKTGLLQTTSDASNTNDCQSNKRNQHERKNQLVARTAMPQDPWPEGHEPEEDNTALDP